MTRFRRSKDELARGLSPEQAQAEREAWLANNTEAIASVKRGVAQAKEGKFATPNSKGEIVLRIRPTKNVDADYFEFLNGKEVVVEQDTDFYKWIDHYLDKVYGGNAAKLFQAILDQGIGEVITKIHIESDVK